MSKLFGIEVVNAFSGEELNFIAIIGKSYFTKMNNEKIGLCTCCANLQKLSNNESIENDELELDQCKKCENYSIEEVGDLLESGVIQFDHSNDKTALNIIPRKEYLKVLKSEKLREERELQKEIFNAEKKREITSMNEQERKIYCELEIVSGKLLKAV
jgi:hypothetical protein